MGWMQKLYETYEDCASPTNGAEENSEPLLPIYHLSQQVQIEVTIDAEGNYRTGRSRVLLDKAERPTLMPCTEKSASRSSGPAPHPLFDSFKYLTPEYSQYRELKPAFQHCHEEYMEQLAGWCTSQFSHPKVCAVWKYLKKHTLMQDLIQDRILFVDESGSMPMKWAGDKESTPDIYKVMAKDPADALIRFQVISADGSEDLETQLWTIRAVQQSFIDYQNSLPAEQDLCYVQGKSLPVSVSSPKYIRYPGDNAKLISANDTSGFTYRGKFKNAQQAFSVARETTEKAHNALKWLIQKQAYKNGEQVILAWGSKGKETVPICAGSALLRDFLNQDTPPTTGEAFAESFSKALGGYGNTLEDASHVSILGLDSATPGRLSIFYYRETPEKDLWEYVKFWHTTCTWQLRLYIPAEEKGGKAISYFFEGAPSPKQIIEAAYSSRADEKISKQIMQRLLQCISEGAVLPFDTVSSAVRRAANPPALDKNEYAQTLSVACALVRKYYNDKGRTYFKEHRKDFEQQNKEYKERWVMGLNRDETDRSYLYGRLLAVAHQIEFDTYDEKERNGKRQTNAERMMQPFSKHPFSTWPLLYLKTLPYQSKMPMKQRNYRLKELEEISNIIERTHYENDAPLDGLFLLGYFCQRKEFYKKKDTDSNPSDTKTEEAE